MAERETTALALAEPQAPLALFGTNDPIQIIEVAARVATSLAQVVNERKLYAIVNGKKFPTVEAWTLLGSMLGVFPITEWVHELREEDGSLRGFEARVRAQTLAGRQVGAGEARCIRGESKTWHASAQEFALSSMAQTRATSKALRGPLDFVFKLAGFQPTPAEEMDGLSNPSGEISLQQASAQTQAAFRAHSAAPSGEVSPAITHGAGAGERSGTEAVLDSPPLTAAIQESVPAKTSPPPQTAGGPRAKRGNVVAAPAPAAVAPPVTAQVTLEEPLEGQEQYLNELRRQARQAAAVIRHLQVKRENLLHAEEIKLGNRQAAKLPSLAPNLEADDSLRQFVEKRYPGKRLVDLGETELDGSDDAPGILRALQSIIDALHAKGFHE